MEGWKGGRMKGWRGGNPLANPLAELVEATPAFDRLRRRLVGRACRGHPCLRQAQATPRWPRLSRPPLPSTGSGDASLAKLVEATPAFDRLRRRLVGQACRGHPCLRQAQATPRWPSLSRPPLPSTGSGDASLAELVEATPAFDRLRRRLVGRACRGHPCLRQAQATPRWPSLSRPPLPSTGSGDASLAELVEATPAFDRLRRRLVGRTCRGHPCLRQAQATPRWPSLSRPPLPSTGSGDASLAELVEATPAFDRLRRRLVGRDLTRHRPPGRLGV
jgi:hypothetical protein